MRTLAVKSTLANQYPLLVNDHEHVGVKTRIKEIKEKGFSAPCQFAMHVDAQHGLHLLK